MRRPEIEERFQRDWGFELPESIFRFCTFLGSLAVAERQALQDLDVSPFGVMDLFADPGRHPRDGVDVRAHGRFYRDPPEFLTFMHGGSDGLHFGLWFDDGRTCSGVASYYNNDGGGIDATMATPLEALRAVLERCWRDLADDDADDAEVSAQRSRASRLREALAAFETGDRPEVGANYLKAHTSDFTFPPVRHDRITTLDGAGALVTGETALDRPPHNAADEYAFAKYMHAQFEDATVLQACVADARRRCEAGDPAEALVLGRDLHWASAGDPSREHYANELLETAYRTLERPRLADIAETHHRHRNLPRVDVLEVSRQ